MFNKLRQRHDQRAESVSPKKSLTKSAISESQDDRANTRGNVLKSAQQQKPVSRFEIFERNKLKRKMRTHLDEILDEQEDFFSKYSDKLRGSGTRALVEVSDSSDDEDASKSMELVTPKPDVNSANSSNRSVVQQRIISDGLNNGYSAELIVEDLDSKTRQLAEEMRSIFKGAKKSVFRDRIEEYATQNNALSISLGNLVEDNMLPSTGYYGLKGREYITSTLMVDIGQSLKNIQARSKWMSKFKLDDLVITILAPEVMLRIIELEMKVDYDGALEILEESSEFGRVYYSTNSAHVKRREEETTVDSPPEEHKPVKRAKKEHKLVKMNDGLDISSSSEDRDSE